MPKGWEWCIVDDFAYVASGSTPSKDSFVEEGVPYIKMYNLRNQKIDFDFHPQYVKREVHEGKLQRSKTEVGDLIMNIVGPPLGKLAIIPPSLPESNFNQAAVLIRPYLYKDVLVKYLFYYLSEMSEINSISTKGTAGQVNISLTQSQNMRIALPPYEEQKRIIKTVENLFQTVDIIDKGSVDITISIGKVKSKILDLAIHGKLVPQDPNDEPAIELLKHINPKFTPCDNAHLGKTYKVPRNWEWCKLPEICDYIFAGGDKPTEFNKSYTKEYHIPIYSNGIENDGLYGYTKHAVVEKPSITISARGTIGFTCIRNVPFVPIIRLITIIPKNEISINYIRYAIEVSIMPSEGSSIPQLTVPTIKRYSIPLPPLNEQLRIVAKIEELFGVLDEIQKSIEA